MAAQADDTLAKIIHIMGRDSRFYPQVRVRNEGVIDFMQQFKVNKGRAFAYFIDDFFQVMNLIRDKKIITDMIITKRIKLSDFVEKFKCLYKENNNKFLIVNEDFRN